MRPRELSCASFGTAGMKDRRNLRCSFLRACGFGLLGQSKDTMAIMLIFAPLPKPAAQDPRQRVPAGSSRVPTFARPD